MIYGPIVRISSPALINGIVLVGSLASNFKFLVDGGIDDGGNEETSTCRGRKKTH